MLGSGVNLLYALSHLISQIAYESGKTIIISILKTVSGVIDLVQNTQVASDRVGAAWHQLPCS